jgi:uncharacterized membrane protein
MESKAKFLGHPVHQMLIVFPLGLLATAVVFDLIYLVTDNPAWSGVSPYLIAAGLIGGLLAAPFGFIDWRAIPDNTRAKSIGLAHGAGNLVVVLLFFVSWLLRRDAPETPTALALLLSFAGAGLALVTAWLGGELVVRLGVGVYDDANLNASNSLTHKKSA